MGLIFLIVAGGALGWLAAFIVDASGWREVQLNIASGVAGSLLTGLVVNPIFGSGELISGQYSIEALANAMLGAIAVLTCINCLRQREPG